MSFPTDVSYDQFIDLEDITEVGPIDGPADPIPTSLVVGTIAATIVGPVALLPAIGWWAAKAFTK